MSLAHSIHANDEFVESSVFLFKNRARYRWHMAHEGDCFLVPGPVRMSDACLQAMATPVMTARGTEFRDVMADLNAGLRTAFNLTPSLVNVELSRGLVKMVTRFLPYLEAEQLPWKW